MKTQFQALDTVLQSAIPEQTPAAQLVVCHAGTIVFHGAHGWLNPADRSEPTQPSTRFDLASVTKLFVTTAFMSLVDRGDVALDQSVATVLPDFSGDRPIRPYEDPLQSGDYITVVEEEGVVDASTVTFRHLLTHTAGLPAWRPLFQQVDAAAAATLARTTFFSAPLGQEIIYSDIGLILLGMSVAALTGQPLAQAVDTLVLNPLGLTETSYRPLNGQDSSDPYAICDPALVAPTEYCRWRERRVRAEVHDENAAQLGGVSGHAGLFSTAHDVARFGQMFLDGGKPLLRQETVAEMRREQVHNASTRRGLGFLLWSADPTASSNPFSPAVFGHTGFTGTSLWIDPERDLVVALLTNEVYHGRANRQIAPLRVAVHRAVVDAVDRS